MKNNNKIKYLRLTLLAVLVILISVQAYFHQVKGGGEAASIHALCPYGGLESLYTFLSSGTFIQKIFSGTIVLLIITILLAVFFRRSFCGLICPFGAIQEFLGIIGKKIFRKKYSVPRKIDKPLRYLKYVVLLITLIYAWKTSGLWMAPYDPWSAYAHLSEGIPAVAAESLIGLILLFITIAGSLIYERFFCKYLCPMGVFYGIISKISPNKIIRNNDKCINCGMCSKNCPVNIDVAHCSEITSLECINCQSCILSCPRAGALEIKQGKKSIKPIYLMLIVFSLFFGGILGSKIFGIFETNPKPITAETFISADDIKGYMTLEEVSTATKIDIKALYKKLNIPENIPSNTKLKDLKNYVSNFETETAREILKQK